MPAAPPRTGPALWRCSECSLRFYLLALSPSRRRAGVPARLYRRHGAALQLPRRAVPLRRAPLPWHQHRRVTCLRLSRPRPLVAPSRAGATRPFPRVFPPPHACLSPDGSPLAQGRPCDRQCRTKGRRRRALPRSAGGSSAGRSAVPMSWRLRASPYASTGALGCARQPRLRVHACMHAYVESMCIGVSPLTVWHARRPEVKDKRSIVFGHLRCLHRRASWLHQHRKERTRRQCRPHNGGHELDPRTVPLNFPAAQNQ